MAATSLAEQLKKLTVPQTTLYREDKKKASLLFNPKEAALKDRDTFYEIGISGLNELTALYEGFRVYEDTLFSLSSKDFERAAQSKEVNQNLDKTVEKFLYQLSPYLLLQSSHKALEWLVNRYHIHQYNQDAIMGLILPYHETKIFTRFIQLMNIKNSSNRWNWLSSLQNAGIPLAKQVLYNQCASNTSTLQFISKITLSYVQEYGERASQLNTIFSFFCSTSIGTINTAKKVTESLINALLPTLIKALESPIPSFRSSAYIILGYLTTKASLKEDTVTEIIDKLLNMKFDLSYDMVLLTNLIYSTQSQIDKVSDTILQNLSVDTMSILCLHLKKLIDQQISVQAFVLKFLRSALPIVQSHSECYHIYKTLPEILIDAVDLKSQSPEKIIQCILDNYQPLKETPSDDDGSDLEFVDDDKFPALLKQWYSSLLKSIEQKYPDAFDTVVMQELKNKKKQKYLTSLLSFKPEVAHKVGDTTLFENLNHINASLRVEAVNYIKKNFNTLKEENIDFLTDTIINRLKDDNPDVVTATLSIPTDYLKEVLNEIDLSNVFVHIIARDLRHFKKWKPILNEAIVKFCSLEALPVTQEIVLAIMPHLFPYDEISSLVAYNIISSPWGKKFALTNGIKGLTKSMEDNHEVISQSTFNLICVKRNLNFDEVLDVNLLNKSNTLDVCIYLLLKSCSFKTTSINELSSILNLLLDTVKNREIYPSSDGSSFSSHLIPEFVILARQDKIHFQFMEYIFIRLIEDMSVKSIQKPWCNVCSSKEMILVRRLYEICVTGCFIPNYSSNYGKMLEKLLNKYFSTPKEKFEFVANISFGHILYATDPKDVIGPELQIRSLKLLDSYIAHAEDIKCLADSEVILVMVLFNLNNPLSIIRQFVINMIEKIIKNNGSDTSKTSIQLYKELHDRREELILDHEQIQYVLSDILTQKNSSNKTFRRNCLLKLMGLLIDGTAVFAMSELLKILSNLNNYNVFCHVVPSLKPLEEKLRNDKNQNIVFNIYESKLARNVYERITVDTVSVLDKDQVWDSIKLGLKEYRQCILDDNQTHISPAVLIMRQIDEEVFKKIPKQRQTELIELICSAGSFSNNSSISSAAFKTMKKLYLHFDQFKPILDNMLKAVDPACSVQKKSKSSVSMLSYQLVETNEWKLGITLLEYIQNKKKMTVNNSLVSIFFQLLDKCLRFDEQSYVEYTKQLILSSLWYYCKKFVNDSDKEQVKSLKSVFNIELVVQCIRGTQNPQTHHHALILLSHAAYLLPDQVLHHTMEIFTFMGSSVLRHDDAYSFQIITKIIETLIPILVKLDKDVNEYSTKELEKLQKRVVPVLRIFADVVLDVPEHRRLPLYRKLIETIGPSNFLWVFLALLLEAYVTHFSEIKSKDTQSKKNLADKEAPVNRLDFGQSIVLEFPPEVGLESFIKLISFMKSLPLQKDEDTMDVDVDTTDIFSVSGHTPIQLRHYKYVLITFSSTCLSSSRFIHHASNPTDLAVIEGHYKTFIINILTFVQSISKVGDEKTAKYWRVMLHHSYDLLDHTNNLLTVNMFLSVVRGLMKHNLQTVRRKAMELLNSKIQFSPEFFADCDKDLFFSLLPSLLDIVKTIDSKEISTNETAAQELELNQQTALLSLKLLTRMLGAENPEAFQPVLESITGYTCKPDISGNVMASVVLCLAELCGNLKAHALASLRKFMPALIKVLKKQREAETPELILLSTVTAIAKIVESLPLFLSPYLQKILYEYSILLAKWQSYDQECSKVSAIVTKLGNIKKKIASSIPPRVLIPVVNQTHDLILEREQFGAVGPVMSLLADSFANVTTADFAALQQDLTAFFLSALQFRSDAVQKDVDITIVDAAEDEIVNALVSLVLKLSESNFRPFYFKIYDWAIRSNVEGHKDRSITFYRLSSSIADKLKGLFVLFAGHFIKNAAELLDACNTSKTETLYFDEEEKCIVLVDYILKTLQIVFLYDSQNFVNKDRFETLMQPIVDQLENTLGGVSNVQEKAKKVLIPCISQFAVATADDSLWKLLNYQILLKTRHNEAAVRLTALDCLVSTATQLGSSWLPLLAESVPFLAELLEDGGSKIEDATKEAIRKLEQILGEPLEKYF